MTNPNPHPNPNTNQTERPELQAAIDELAGLGFLGVQLRVNDEHGEWVGSAGLSELGGTEKPSTDGHFRVGSTTKTFTATMALNLVAEGRIELDSPVADRLPDFTLDPRITLRMLLQHTSGVFNYTGEVFEDGTIAPGIAWQGQEYVDNRFRSYTSEELVRFALAKPARFEPGADWSYANTNYVLIKLLIEKITGHPLAEEADRVILGPLGLSGTVLPGDSPEIAEPHANGYYVYQVDDEWRLADVTRFNYSWASSAGDMISTTRDLHLFVSALMGGKLLPSELLAEMRTPHQKVPYGLGLFIEESENGVIYNHNGGFWGWAALMYGNKDGSRTLTASFTTGDRHLEFAAQAELFQKAQQLLTKEVFGK